MMIKFVFRLIITGVTFCSICISGFAAIKIKPTPLAGLQYNQPLLAGDYDNTIPTVDSLLDFTVGEQIATPMQIVTAIKAWDESSHNMQLIEYARSHENRPLYYAIISSQKNLKKLKQVKADLSKLASPKDLSNLEADSIIAELPAVAWMAYSIHGNESSGSDAALAAIYHLIASKDSDVQELLSKSIIIIDPCMNPDGRARFTKGLEQSRGVVPNIDDQSLLHDDAWPRGRTNHYLFDLNRDFILAVHPETIGRVKAINEWHPQLMIDAHEMDSQDSYLFSPAREPINKNMPKYSKKWGNVFAKHQADVFDRQSWPYYTGEWFESLYPGYSSYTEFRGTIHILYEQAQLGENGISQSNGRIVTYQEAVHHQLLSTLTNLRALAEHSKEIYRDYVKDRRKNISTDSPYSDTSFAILPNKNKTRWLVFIKLMQLQGFELFSTTKTMSYTDSINQLGEKVTAKLPVGTLIIRNRQPEARLLSAMLEFDVKIDNAVLVEERQKILRGDSSLIYDVTAWNLTMMHGVEAFTIPDFIDSNIKPYQLEKLPMGIVKKDKSIAYIVDGADDASVGFAARLMEQGIQVRIIDRKSKFDKIAYSRGSVVVSRYDNEFYQGKLDDIVEKTANEMEITAQAIISGFGDGDLPDIGGKHFRLLKQPKIAILARGDINSYDYGAIWHSIDSNLAIRHSHLDLTSLNKHDLRRYNTLIIPDRRGGKLSKHELTALNAWVTGGGTLIAINRSTKSLIDPEAKSSSVREIKQTFKKMDYYDLSLQQEWLSQQNEYDVINDIWRHNVAEKIVYPWIDKKEAEKEDAFKKRELWLRKFKPSGAMVAARIDQKHWLTFGSPAYIPVLVSGNPILMSDSHSQAVVRLGVYKKIDEKSWKKIVDSYKNTPLSRKIFWSSLPDEYKLTLRMSGLLWPEASQLIANSAYLTREKKGKGQIILFAGQPAFRGSTLAINRLLLNAIVYGSGLGAEHVITNL